jgi:hypothetical protein
MSRIRVLLIATIALSVLLRAGLTVFFPEERVDESLYLEEVAPGVMFSEKSGKPPHYGSSVGTVAFNTYDVVPGIRGYAGPIRVLLALDKHGTIIGIRILEHKETPNYVHSMETPGYLAQFLGKSLNDPFEIDRDIDGISRATVSVRALADTVRESSRKVASSAMAIEVKGAEKKRAASLKWIAYASLFALALAAYYASRRRRLPNVLRDIVLVIGIFVVGVWLSTPFSILHVFNAALMRFTTDVLWLVVVVSTVVSILIAGRFYCGWLCPFGALAEFVGRIPLGKWKVPINIDDRWRNAKYFLLALVVLVVIPTGKTGFGNFETYVTLFSLHGTYLMWAVVAVSLIANLRVKRFWCRFLCPVAALTGVLSRRDDRYVSALDCPMTNRPAPLIAECVRCNRCYAGARKDK